jgi:hypothetical protein
MKIPGFASLALVAHIWVPTAAYSCLTVDKSCIWLFSWYPSLYLTAVEYDKRAPVAEHFRVCPSIGYTKLTPFAVNLYPPERVKQHPVEENAPIISKPLS